jgi:tetratricopeptide (TPR) repeat protein
LSRPHHHYEFGPFRLDTRERILLRDGCHLPLKPKVYETLLALITESGHVVDKEELMRRVWPDVAVEENNLTGIIFALRRTFDDEAVKLSESRPVMLAVLGHTYSMAGKHEQARSVLEKLKGLSDQSYVSPLDIGIVYTGLGDKKQAIEWLEKAYEERLTQLDSAE